MRGLFRGSFSVMECVLLMGCSSQGDDPAHGPLVEKSDLVTENPLRAKKRVLEGVA